MVKYVDQSGPGYDPELFLCSYIHILVFIINRLNFLFIILYLIWLPINQDFNFMMIQK